MKSNFLHSVPRNILDALSLMSYSLCVPLRPLRLIGEIGGLVPVDLNQQPPTRSTDVLTVIRERQGDIGDNKRVKDRHMILLVTAK